MPFLCFELNLTVCMCLYYVCVCVCTFFVHCLVCVFQENIMNTEHYSIPALGAIEKQQEAIAEKR